MSGYSTGPIITGVGLAGLLASEYAGWKPGRAFFKPLASTGFLITAYTSPNIDTRFGHTIFGSLILSFFGDLFLIPGTPGLFRAGLASFLVGHLGFAYAFAQRGLDTKLFTGAAVGATALAAVVWRWLAPSLPQAEKVPVALYTAVISAMSAFAIGSAFNTPAPWWQIGGALIFQLSDIFVARQQFVTPSFTNPALGLPTYYFAQQLIASLLWF
jgi:uncharacterized membrane protein YhhN